MSSLVSVHGLCDDRRVPLPLPLGRTAVLRVRVRVGAARFGERGGGSGDQVVPLDETARKVAFPRPRSRVSLPMLFLVNGGAPVSRNGDVDRRREVSGLRRPRGGHPVHRRRGRRRRQRSRRRRRRRVDPLGGVAAGYLLGSVFDGL
jgi:hypothetical protein